MPYDAYPTTEDITTSLTSMGFTAPSTLDDIRKAVIRDWERGTGYVPFLGASVATAKTYDPPRNRDLILSFEGGLWDITSIEINGTAIDADDYNLLPMNADGETRGFDEVRFLYHPGDVPASVVVTGKAGYAEKLPDEVYRAIFEETQRRAIRRMPAAAGTATEIKQGPVTLKFGNSNDDWLNDIEEAWDSLIVNYRKI